MFVTYNKAVYTSLVAVDATKHVEHKQSKNATDPDPNRIRQRLVNLLVKGEHRDRNYFFRRTKQQMADAGRRLNESALTAAADKQDHTILDELAAGLGLTPDEIESMITTDIRGLLIEVEANMERARTMPAIIQLKAKLDKAKIKYETLSIKPPDLQTRITDIESHFTATKKRVDETIVQLRNDIKNAADTDRDINDAVDRLEDVFPDEGVKFAARLAARPFDHADEADIVRCAECEQNKRFPAMLLSYEADDLTFVHPRHCECIKIIAKFVFMADMTETYLDRCKNTSDTLLFADLFIPEIETVLIQNPNRSSFTLQFIYPRPDAYRSARIRKTTPFVPQSDVSAVLEELPEEAALDMTALDNTSDPFAALELYAGFDVTEAMAASTEDDLDLSVFGIQSAAAPAAPSLLSRAFSWFTASPAADVEDNSTIPMPITMVAGQAGGRSQSRRVMYDRILNGIGENLKRAYSKVNFATSLVFKPITGNARVGLAIDATITLSKVATSAFLVVGAQGDTPYLELFQRDIDMLSPGAISLRVPSITNVTFNPNEKYVLRALIVEQQPKSKIDTTNEYSVLFQKLAQDGLIVILNSQFDDKEIKDFNSMYSLSPRQKHIRLEVANAHVSDQLKCLVFFYSDTKGKESLETIKTHLITEKIKRIDPVTYVSDIDLNKISETVADVDTIREQLFGNNGIPLVPDVTAQLPAAASAGQELKPEDLEPIPELPVQLPCIFADHVQQSLHDTYLQSVFRATQLRFTHVDVADAIVTAAYPIVLFVAFIKKQRICLSESTLNRLELYATQTDNHVIFVALRPSDNQDMLNQLEFEGPMAEDRCWRFLEFQVDHRTKQLHNTERNNENVSQLKQCINKRLFQPQPLVMPPLDISFMVQSHAGSRLWRSGGQLTRMLQQ